MFSRYTSIAILSLWGNLATAIEVPMYDVYEINLSTTTTYTNPYIDVSLSATFTGPSSTTITIPGFWDGGNSWKIRVAPTKIGDWTLTNVTSNDAQLNNQGVGTIFTARAATAPEIDNNEVLRHGFVRVSKIYPHTFEHADGTPFFFMGDTQWERAALSTDGLTMNGQQLFQEYQFNHVNSRAKKGFTVASMAWIGEGSFNLVNEGGSPFTGNSSNQILNPSFFQNLDSRIAFMTSKGIRPMLVITGEGVWKGQATYIENYTKYLVARYAAYDVIWYGIKEYQEYGGTLEVDAFGNTIEATDPYNHPTSVHPESNGGSGTSALNNRAWLDFHSLQDRVITNTIYDLGKPIVITEAWYKCPEIGFCTWGNFNDNELLNPDGIWTAAFNGGWNAGYEYWANPRGDTNEILANMDIPSINYHKYLKDFFSLTEYEKLIPHDEMVLTGTSEMMAQENNIGAITGNEYVAFLPLGGNITINLGSATGDMYVKWYDPSTGTYTDGANITANNNQIFSAPTNKPWVLLISAVQKNTGNPAPPPAPAPPASPPVIPTGISLSKTTKAVTKDTSLRINIGGPDYVDNLGNLWKADYGFNVGKTTTTTSDITGTNNPTLYQSGRYDPQGGSELMYSFTLEAGTYSVTLHFSETFTNNRKFDVAMEGNIVLPSLDIHSEVGFSTALTKTVSVDVNDGELNMEFIHQVENPVINAIEIQSTP